MMHCEIIETEKYIIRIDAESRYLEYTIKEGITYGADDARKSKAEVTKRYPGLKFFVLGEGVEFFTMTKEARELCATKEHLDNAYCVAFYTRNISIMLLGEMFNKINKPAVPTKIFTDRERAKKWLRKQMEKLNNSSISLSGSN
jgi:hypothetical protein